MIDISALFKDAVVAGVPLTLFVLALVQWIKGFGLSGNAVRVASMGVGLVLGVGYQLSIAMPVGFAGWFTASIFGLALGLFASGAFDAVAAMLAASRKL